MPDAGLLLRPPRAVVGGAGLTTPVRSPSGGVFVEFCAIGELARRGAVRTPVGEMSDFEEVPAMLSRLVSCGPATKQVIRVA